MSCPTFEKRRMACRSITRILGCGIAAAAGWGWAGAFAESAADGREAARIIPAAAAIRKMLSLAFVMGLESCSCAEVDDLRMIVGFLDYGQAEVDLHRSERRFPGNRDARRDPQPHVVFDAHRIERHHRSAVFGLTA